MQHKRSRLSTKILAFVLILALVFPASAFASVADVAKDTRAPGKSLANTYPAYTDIDWQISLAEDATATVTLPTNLTENELAAAMDAGLSLSLDRDTQRGYLSSPTPIRAALWTAGRPRETPRCFRWMTTALRSTTTARSLWSCT